VCQALAAAVQEELQARLFLELFSERGRFANGAAGSDRAMILEKNGGRASGSRAHVIG
jgi:hypothetical protein